MKKKLLILASILLLLICIVMPVNAADVTSNVNSRIAHRGDTVTFEATLSSGIEVGSGFVELIYDDTVLKLDSGAWNVSGAFMLDFTKETKDGVFAYQTSAEISGTIFTATFEVLDTAAFGTTAVSLKIELKDGSNVDLAVTNNSGSITVECLHDFSRKDTSDKYLKSSASCTSPALYYYSCATCGAAGTATFESGNALPHSYKKQVVTDAYLKSPASCTAKALYYYACETCGAKGSETYEYGDALPHTYNQQNTAERYLKSAADCENAAVYYKSCSCGEKGTETFPYGTKLGHTGGTATCTAKAICSRCESEYGDLLNHTYDQEKATEAYLKSDATCTQKAVYYKSCTCGAKGSTTFAYGTTLPHVYDQKVSTKVYLKSVATCTAKAAYYYSCKCGARGTDTFTVGEEPSHAYRTTWSSNAKEHWHVCAKCGDKKDIAAHTPGAQATEYTAQTCTVCEYVITPAFGHTHSYGNAWEHDSAKHWHTCLGCSEHDQEAEHVYDNACDATCNICDYVRTVTHSYTTEWLQDASNHWHACTVCHEKTDEAKHIPGTEATETTAQTCTICGYVIKEALGHTHVFGTAWKSDATTHWHACACGEKAEQAAHVSTGDHIASCTKKAICDVCGAEYGDVAAHTYDSAWQNDADCHWHACACGEKAEQAAHVSTGDHVASCTKKAICDVCGAEYGDVAAHTYDSAWQNDADCHWHACACGEKADTGAHAWDAGVVTKPATYAESGIKTYTCTVCAWEKTEKIDQLIDTGDTAKPADDTWSGCGSTVTIGFLLPAVFAMAWMMRKKEKDDD